MPGFYELFLSSVARCPQNVAVEMRHAPGAGESIERLTYTQLQERVERVGAWLAKAGPIRGERAAILAANGPLWVTSYLGVMSAGGVAVPLDTAFTAEQVAKLLRDSGSRYLFCDRRHLPTAEKAAAGIGAQLVLLEAIQGLGKASVRNLRQVLAALHV